MPPLFDLRERRSLSTASRKSSSAMALSGRSNFAGSAARARTAAIPAAWRDPARAAPSAPRRRAPLARAARPRRAGTAVDAGVRGQHVGRIHGIGSSPVRQASSMAACESGSSAARRRRPRAAPSGRGSCRPSIAEATEIRTAAALDGLRSPFLSERREAGPGAGRAAAGDPRRRAGRVAAGDEPLRVELADVLATDGSVDAATLLIDAWRTGPPALAVEARRALLKNPDATRAGHGRRTRARPFVAPRGSPADASNARSTPSTELLERDTVERLFLSRKSKSGGTGVYRGQYDVLLPHREMALDVCYHILVDRAMRLPGDAVAPGRTAS